MDNAQFGRIKLLVMTGVLISPENARELVREIETAQKLLDHAGIPVKNTLSERVAYLVGRCEGLEMVAK